MKKIPLRRPVAIGGLLLLLGAVLVLSGVYTDYIELREIGENFAQVFLRDFHVSLITAAIAFALFFVVVLCNFLIVRSNLLGLGEGFSYLRRLSPIVLLSLLSAGLLASYARGMIAENFLPFLTSEWFDMGDPVFHRDVGYYVFQRPFYTALTDALLTLGVFLMLSTALSYVGLYARFDFYNLRRLLREKSIVVHQSSCVVIYFAILGASLRYRAEEILFKNNSGLVGGSYVDINIWMQYYKIMPILLLVIVVLTVLFALNSKYGYAVMTVLLYPASLLAAALIAQLTQTLVVAPDEYAIQSAYLQNNIRFTREAYGLSRIETRDLPVTYDLSGKALMNNLNTVNNIPLISGEQTVSTANKIQSVRSYYRFHNADIVSYPIGGEPAAVTISARELNTDALEESARSYVNTTMRYTHGMGVVMNPVNRITAEGQPYFIIRDIPPRSLGDAPEVYEPRIYFGETAKGHVVVNTRDGEADEIETGGYQYAGMAGVPMNLLNRLVYALKTADWKLLISEQITPQSRLLTNRNITERVRLAAPFLRYDADPYLLVGGGGRLVWVVDAYTTSQWFPYAQYTGNYNYIRNSVKAVVDAYDGSVRFYITDPEDPLVKSYARIYPTLFEQTELPADLAVHLRYPKDIFKAQSELLKRYHVGIANDFYQQKHLWAAAREKGEAGRAVSIEPYYTMLRLPGEEKEELVLLLPYTPAGKDGMVAYLAARRNGRLVQRTFGSMTELVQGPYEAEGRIDNDAILSQDMTAWGASGARAARGSIMTVPIENSMLYVEPIYVAADEAPGTVSELKRVVVVYGDKVSVKPTLDEALKALFGVSRPTVITTNEESMEEVIDRVVLSFDELKAYSKEGDWENYGRSLRELEENIYSLKERNEENKKMAQPPLTAEED